MFKTKIIKAFLFILRFLANTCFEALQISESVVVCNCGEQMCF